MATAMVMAVIVTAMVTTVVSVRIAASAAVGTITITIFVTAIITASIASVIVAKVSCDAPCVSKKGGKGRGRDSYTFSTHFAPVLHCHTVMHSLNVPVHVGAVGEVVLEPDAHRIGQVVLLAVPRAHAHVPNLMKRCIYGRPCVKKRVYKHYR